MSDGFVELIDRANSFFVQLKANNTKAFFEEHKAFYNCEIKKPAELLADILGEEIARLTKQSLKPKLFRIHRDVRFSKDKTPYNTHLHMMWATPMDTAPAWFFGASPDYITIGTGVMALKGGSLTTYRTMVDTCGDDLSDAIETARKNINANISDWGPEPLKRVPKPYAADHPHAGLLKRKALAITAPPAKNWRKNGLIPAITQTVKGLRPTWSILSDTFT